MALYKVTNITPDVDVGFSVEGSEDYTLAPGDHINVTRITQELRNFEEEGHISIEAIISPDSEVVDSINCTSTDHAPSGRAVCEALDGKEDVGVAANLLSDHVTDPDPHPQYTTFADVDAAIAAAVIGGGGSVPYMQRVSIDNTIVTNKGFPLDHTPVNPQAVMLIPHGGIPQRPGLDYNVTGNSLSWNSLGLDGFLGTSDIVDVYYNY